jgi:hypothetical protein
MLPCNYLWLSDIRANGHVRSRAERLIRSCGTCQPNAASQGEFAMIGDSLNIYFYLKQMS